MKPLFRPAMNASRRAVPLTRPALGALLMMSAFGASAQQWTAGQSLWNTSTCVGCHSNQFPLALMQSTYANNTVALSRLNSAIASNSIPMSTFRSGGALALSDTQKDNLSYYISNFRAEPNLAPQSSTTLQANQETVVRLFNNGKRVLQIVANGGIVLTGANATQFEVRGINNTCFGLVVQPSSSCDVAVRYQPTGAASASHTATLVISHNGEPAAQSTVTFAGAIASPPPSAPPPAPAPAPASDGGGGALPLALWATLLPAALVARRRRD
jgi:hypothetical protein